MHQQYWSNAFCEASAAVWGKQNIDARPRVSVFGVSPSSACIYFLQKAQRTNNEGAGARHRPRHPSDHRSALKSACASFPGEGRSRLKDLPVTLAQQTHLHPAHCFFFWFFFSLSVHPFLSVFHAHAPSTSPIFPCQSVLFCSAAER